MTQATSPTNATADATVGAAIRSNPAIARAIDTIVEEVGKASSTINDVRGPVEGAKVEYQALMDRAAAVKGRGLLYPYIGSGAGNGALVELADGSVKWDMITGIGVHFMGHSHPAVVRAQAEASLDDTTKHGNLQSGFEAYAFGERLVKLARRSSKLKHAFITTSGAMANESAIKVCYQKKYPASRVLAFKHCFMGRSVTMCQIGDSAGGRQGIPLTTQVDYMPFWNEVAAEKVGGQNKFIDHCLWRLDQYVERYPDMHACFIFELVQGEGGFNVAPRDFHKALMERCRDHGIPIWDDEIQSFGRTEQMFAYEMYDLGEYVDVFCVGKMTQACATLYTEEMNPKGGLLSGTFTGNTSDFTVGNALLDTLENGGFYGPDGAFAKHHSAFTKHAEALAAKHPEWFGDVMFQNGVVGGVGGMMRLTPCKVEKDKVAKLCKTAFDEGLICFWCGHGPYHLRFLPPLPAFKMEDWPRVFEVLERSMAKVAAS